VPPANLCTAVNGAPSGICVLGQVTPQGQVLKPVENDRISGLQIQGFPANGVFGYGTDRLSVSDVTALNDGDYGIARFVSTRSRLVENRTAGNQEAGLYVGDSPDADTVVSGNRTWNNGFGIFVRHSHQVAVTGNQSWGNCLGALVLDDGQPGGVGDVTVRDNRVHDNNKFCPPNQEHPFPVSGGGIVAVGAVRTQIDDNAVSSNAGTTPVSGGVVLVSAQPIDGGTIESNDTVQENRLHGDKPADIIWDGSGAGNQFVHNECTSSSPAGLCTK
jgi:nitrous oxidase accessory protein NosD